MSPHWRFTAASMCSSSAHVMKSTPLSPQTALEDESFQDPGLQSTPGSRARVKWSAVCYVAAPSRLEHGYYIVTAVQRTRTSPLVAIRPRKVALNAYTNARSIIKL